MLLKSDDVTPAVKTFLLYLPSVQMITSKLTTVHWRGRQYRSECVACCLHLVNYQASSEDLLGYLIAL